MTSCVFCERLASDDVTAASELAAVFPDAFPLTRGHILILPRRHESDYFRLTRDEQAAMWELVNALRDRFASEQRTDGFNLGVNVGAAAGQTVGHAHIHVIPRYAGDVDDPRGGIRWIIPAKARYWEARDTGH